MTSEDTMSDTRNARGSKVLLTFSRARRQLGVSQPELLRLILASGVVPRRRPLDSLWFLTEEDIKLLERLNRVRIARDTW
jgi:hypothetical protein